MISNIYLLKRFLTTCANISPKKYLVFRVFYFSITAVVSIKLNNLEFLFLFRNIL